MKNIIFFLIILSIVGCRSTKKVTRSLVKAEKQTETVQSVQVKESANISNDKLTNQETVTVTTKYYPPPNTKDNTEKGAVESVTITTTKNVEVDKGKTEIVNEKKEDTKTIVAEKSEVEAKVKEVKKTVIKAWMIYLAAIAVLCGLLYAFRKSPVIGKILATIKVLFK